MIFTSASICTAKFCIRRVLLKHRKTRVVQIHRRWKHQESYSLDSSGILNQQTEIKSLSSFYHFCKKLYYHSCRVTCLSNAFQTTAFSQRFDHRYLTEHVNIVKIYMVKLTVIIFHRLKTMEFYKWKVNTKQIWHLLLLNTNTSLEEVSNV